MLFAADTFDAIFNLESHRPEFSWILALYCAAWQRIRGSLDPISVGFDEFAQDLSALPHAIGGGSFVREAHWLDYAAVRSLPSPDNTFGPWTKGWSWRTKGFVRPFFDQTLTF